MDREIREEREFSQNVDRLLTGRETKAGEDTGEEYDAALRFSRKLVELRESPSPQFKEQLKKALLLKLEEREAKANITLWNIFSSIIPKTPVWRGAMVTVTVGVLAVLVLWGTGMFSQAPTTVVGTEGTPMFGLPLPTMLQLETIPSGTVTRSAGESFEVDILLKNIGTDTITIEPYPPGMEIQKADTFEAVRTFKEGDEKRDIASSEGLVYTFVWDQKDDGGQLVGSGSYVVALKDVSIMQNADVKEAYPPFYPLIELVIQ